MGNVRYRVFDPDYISAALANLLHYRGRDFVARRKWIVVDDQRIDLGNRYKVLHDPVVLHSRVEVWRIGDYGAELQLLCSLCEFDAYFEVQRSDLEKQLWRKLAAELIQKVELFLRREGAAESRRSAEEDVIHAVFKQAPCVVDELLCVRLVCHKRSDHWNYFLGQSLFTYPRLYAIILDSVISTIESFTLSRPMPLFFGPPKGRLSQRRRVVSLIITIPTLILPASL